MALRFSDDDMRAIQGAASLRAQQEAQDEYQRRMAQAQAQAQQAQARPTNPLESVLTGIGNSIGNVGTSIYDMFGTGIASIKDLATGNGETGKYRNEWMQHMKKDIYGDENLSDRDYHAKAGGKALDAAATVSDFIPGLGKGAKVALNVGQGIVSGGAQNYIDNGANASLEDTLKGALIGGASAGVGQYVGGKLAPKTAGKSVLSKAINSNIGKAAITGAASGATGGALNSSLNGGDLGQNLSAALQGAGSGAASGAIMAGAMGAAGKGIDALNRKVTGAGADIDTTKTTKAKAAKAPDVADDTTQVKPQLDPETEAKLDRQYEVAKQKQADALIKQYGVIDAPTARSVGDQGAVLTRLYDNYGLETPAEVSYAAKKLTGSDGAVSKMTRKLAASGGDIVATYPETDLDDLIIRSGLGDPKDKAATKARAVKNQVKSIIASTNMSGTDTANANDVLDMVKKLEKRSADYMGKSGDNYHRATTEDKFAASVLNAIADEYKDRIWDSAQDISTVMTPEAVAELKAVFPKNKKYQSAVDNIIASSTNGQELRHSMADLVNGSKIVKNSKMHAGTTGAQLVKAATSANPIVAVGQIGATSALESDAANRMRARRYAKQAANAQARLTGEKTSTGDGLFSKAKDTVINVGNKAVDAVNDVANNGTLYNASYAGYLPTFGEVATSQLARQAGIGTANAQNNQRNLESALQNINGVQNNYDSTMQQIQQNYQSGLQQEQAASPGAQQLDQISRAMELALNAGDLEAYGQLVDLYRQAYKIYAPQTTSATSSLNATQQSNLAKLQSAGTAIDQLEQLYNQAGGGQGRLGGAIAELGGSLGMNSAATSYNNAARGLINQIAAAVGKTDSLNTEGEVQRALDLVPKITDTPEEAQTKLQALRNMLNANMQTYSNIYGVNM